MPRRPKRQPVPQQGEIQREFKCVQPINKEQNILIKTIHNNDIILLGGKAGSGKTHISVGMAAEYLERGLVDRIILSRPVVGAEKEFGILPGSLDEKISPFLTPMLSELAYFLPIKKYIAEEKIIILPVSFMRGYTFKNSFVIIDECENLTYKQLKLILTRFGENSKMILNGDITQSDLDHRAEKDFEIVIDKMKEIAYPEDRIAIFELIKSVRHPLIEQMLRVLE